MLTCNQYRSLVVLAVTKSHACYQLGAEVLDRTGFESHWGRISVAVLEVCLTMINL